MNPLFNHGLLMAALVASIQVGPKVTRAALRNSS